MNTVATRKPRAKPVRTCKLLVPPEAGVPGLLDVCLGKHLFCYMVKPLPSDFGRAFRLRNCGSGEVYNVLLDGERSSCECKGFLRWGRCKHRDSLAELVAAGVLPEGGAA